MPSIKAIGLRMKSVNSTAKITKAMKMVAASKLKGAERKMLGARPFASSINTLMDTKLTPTEEDAAPESALLMAISSDKGLCGGINSRVTKEVKLSLAATAAAGQPDPKVMIIGNKSVSGLQRTHGEYITTTIDEAYNMPCTFTLASFIAEQMLASEAEQHTILYNKFYSVIKQEVVPKVIKGASSLGASGVFDDFEFEGDQEVVLADLYQFNLACTVYSSLLENITSEQASRMTAMDSATNNAKEAGSKLTILYNRLRQAKITTELTEIVAGAESV
jgi:F-type H+-transporting ATPase subunit gamma